MSDNYRKKLYFRSCHRGMKEMDIIFSRFAEKVLPSLPDKDLEDYECLLDLSDNDLLSWVTKQKVPEHSWGLLDRFLSLEYMDE